MGLSPPRLGGNSRLGICKLVFSLQADSEELMEHTFGTSKTAFPAHCLGFSVDHVLTPAELYAARRS